MEVEMPDTTDAPDLASVSFEQTTYGFTWGPVAVERVAEAKGHVTLRLKTRLGDYLITVSPSGRAVTFNKEE